jgi:hypothetical protein
MALESSLRGLQVWFRPRSDRRSGRGATTSQSLGSPNRDSFGTPLRESREKEPFGCHSRGQTQRTPGEGEEAAAPSNIRINQEVQGGEVIPPDGGTVRLKNV